MGERMEVEVVCPRHSAEGRGTCIGCQADFTRWLPVKPGSLTAARLRLADAAEAKEVTLNAFAAPEADENGPECEAWLAACNEYKAALSDVAALRTKRAGG